MDAKEKIYRLQLSWKEIVYEETLFEVNIYCMSLLNTTPTQVYKISCRIQKNLDELNNILYHYLHKFCVG